MKKKDKIFVSYTIRDNSIDKDFLNQLDRFLKESFDVFIDYLHNDSDAKQERIETELISSDFIVLIKTEQTYYSEWVLKEIEIAKKFKIPIFEFEFNELINKKFLPIINRASCGSQSRT
jgi:hypothetical protein